MTADDRPSTSPSQALRRLEELATQIPGFSAAAAVRRLGGDAVGVAALLAIFVDTSKEVPRRLHVQLRLGYTGAALKTLHSLRGAASTIALDAIVEACAQFEHALRESPDGEGLSAQCERLCRLLDMVIARLRTWGGEPRP
jgi:HPt (histidine-containing phosphotransfer) domain-containing protein